MAHTVLVCDDAIFMRTMISDILMPGSLNGLDLAMMLRHQNPGLPVLLMTGYAAQTGQAMASGFQVLAKPVSATVLTTAIGGVLNARKGGAAGPRGVLGKV